MNLVLEQRRAAAWLWHEVQRDVRFLTEPVRRTGLLVLLAHGTLIWLPAISPAQLGISLLCCLLFLVILRLCNALVCLKTVFKPEGILVAYFRYRARKIFFRRDEILAARLVRLPFWRLPGGGPVYRVYGRRAIALTLTDGRTVYIGTQEDPETLQHILSRYAKD